MGKKLVDTLLTRKRLELGMTQEKVAEVIGCHPATLAKWEAGGASYAYADGHSADYIRKLSDLYGITSKEIEEAISNAYIKAKQGERTLDASEFKKKYLSKILDDPNTSYLRKKRIALGYSAREVADVIGITEQSLYQWEDGYVKKPKNHTAVTNLASLYDWGIVETYMHIEDAYDLAHQNDDVPEVVETEVEDDSKTSILDVIGCAASLGVSPVIAASEPKALKVAEELPDLAGTDEPEKILVSEALCKVLDAIFAFTTDREVYDDVRYTLDSTMPNAEETQHITIPNTTDGIINYISKRIYGNVSFEFYNTTLNTIRRCLER